MVALTAVDTSKDYNTRVGLVAKNITTKGFDLQFFTYADSIVYFLGATWTAIDVWSWKNN